MSWAVSHRDASPFRAAAYAAALIATVLALEPSSAQSRPSRPSTASTQARLLVSYREEGGVGGPKANLTVSTRRQATLERRRRISFRLGSALWTRLKAALDATDMHSLAGDYPPPRGSADEIVYVITVGHDTVRTSAAADGSIPPAKLKRLLTALGEVVSTGERRLAMPHR
jgi:hypothetical protein